MSASRSLRFLLIVLCSVLGCLLLCAAGVASFWILPSEARVLRDEVLRAEGLSARTRFQINLGSCSLGTARLVLNHVKQVDQDARQAISALNKVAVGVYALDGTLAADPRLGRLDARMEARGWKRFLCVHEKSQLVVGYAPAEPKGGNRIPVCLAIHDGKQLIVVSVSADVEPLIGLAGRHWASARTGISGSLSL